ncbi:pentapeptide repeat-containing protein, partial [Hydrocoleum sp. CS-953]|uniref:pentapeptide repeat-containing protein n=1 Tax=Hydrocoleum sp. CS-953 TaxID=1671698 RepID=UPI00352B5BA4
MIRGRQYKEGEKNFRRKNLRGLSFKGENLSGADFSGADIRGTNFRGANLTGAKFCGAKGGLQKRWVVVLLIVVFILAGISGFFSAFTGYLISLIFDNSSLEFQVLGWATLIVAIFFWIVVISRGIIAAFGAFAITVAFAGAFAVAFAGAIVPVAFAITYAGAIAVVGAIAVAIPVAFAVPVAGAIAVPVPVAFAVPVAGAIAVPVPVAIPGAVVTTFLSAYVAYRAIKGDEKHALIRNLAIAFAATGGTCFREADLTDADFSQATLKSTDFRKATLTRTCFRDTKKLDRVRPEKTYLQEAKVRELVKTGQGQDKNFDRLDLRGINLKEANLQDASFIGTDLNRANLQNANLSRARLVQTLLEGANLTRATLTGACVEDWGISNTTKLIEIDCNYIFLKSPEHERRPADLEKNFEPGEF